jgi:hypothetical protein
MLLVLAGLLGVLVLGFLLDVGSVASKITGWFRRTRAK